ncbi:MAG: hypothetical protein WC728_18570 [Elusimicrobiota bacterium]
MAWLPASTAHATVGWEDLIDHLDGIGLDDEEAEDVRSHLETASKVVAEPKVPEQQLKALAYILGREERRPPEVHGVCVDDKGREVVCEPAREGPLFSINVSGAPECPEMVRAALDDLRKRILDRVQVQESTGNKYYDRFIAFLAEQFAGPKHGKDLPRVLEGPPEVKDAIASYTPGPAYVMVGSGFCKLRPDLQRKLMGHELLHHWDNGLDGDPLAPTEDTAYGVMKFL